MDMTFVVTVLTAAITSFFAFMVQERRLRRELRTEVMAEQAVLALLKREDWGKRTFEVIKDRLGGFEDDELRKILVRAGAVKFRRKDDGAEMWGLLSRNLESL